MVSVQDATIERKPTSLYQEPYRSEIVGFWGVIKATVIKDLTMKKRYKADLIGDIIRSFLFIGVFSLFANAYVFTRGVELTQSQTLMFFITGFILIIFDGVALWTPLNQTSNDLYNGTLEYIYSGPQSRIGYFTGNVLSAAIFVSTILVPTLIAVTLIGDVSLVNLGQTSLVILTMVVVLMAFGILIALTAILWKQVSSIAGILNMLFQFLSGFIIPVSAFPDGIKVVSYLLPYTWGIDLIRHYTIGPEWNTLLPVTVEWLILLAYIPVYWFAAKLLLRKVERHSKQKGLHLL